MGPRAQELRGRGAWGEEGCEQELQAAQAGLARGSVTSAQAGPSWLSPAFRAQGGPVALPPPSLTIHVSRAKRNNAAWEVGGGLSAVVGGLFMGVHHRRPAASEAHAPWIMLPFESLGRPGAGFSGSERPGATECSPLCERPFPTIHRWAGRMTLPCSPCSWEGPSGPDFRAGRCQGKNPTLSPAVSTPCTGTTWSRAPTRVWRTMVWLSNDLVVLP